jgi:hypothetical protein
VSQISHTKCQHPQRQTAPVSDLHNMLPATSPRQGSFIPSMSVHIFVSVVTDYTQRQRNLLCTQQRRGVCSEIPFTVTQILELIGQLMLTRAPRKCRLEYLNFIMFTETHCNSVKAMSFVNIRQPLKLNEGVSVVSVNYAVHSSSLMINRSCEVRWLWWPSIRLKPSVP